MKCLVSIHHPAQAHFYRHVVDDLRDAGHEVLVCVRDKEVTTDLLDAFGIDHRVLAETPDSLPRLALMQLRYEWRLLRAARAFEPDVITSVGGVEISHVAPLVGARAVAFDDSEPTPSHAITAPLLDVVCTPRAFDGDFGDAQRRYDGYHELAYLHPDRFEPDPDGLREHGVEPDERYFVLRFVAWQAHHDVGQHGLSMDAKRELVRYLDERGEVYITSEAPLPAEFESYRTPLPPERLHDLLAFADCYVGDSQTMATEAAVLGTPAVRSNSFAGEDDMSNFVELEERYELCYSRADEDDCLRIVKRLVSDPDTAATWRERREALLEDKIDVTAFAVDLLEAEGRTAATAGTAADRLARVRRGLLGGDSE